MKEIEKVFEEFEKYESERLHNLRQSKELERDWRKKSNWAASIKMLQIIMSDYLRMVKPSVLEKLKEKDETIKKLCKDIRYHAKIFEEKDEEIERLNKMIDNEIIRQTQESLLRKNSKRG